MTFTRNKLAAPLLTIPPLKIDRAILETLAYADLFDYPLRLAELHRYLHCVPATLDEVQACLQSNDFPTENIRSQNGYFHLPRREALVKLRMEREASSQAAFNRAIFYGKLLAKLPFIRMVALTGSLAMRNCSSAADLDYMLITTPGRLWLARGFALLLGRLTKIFGTTLCPNLIISERILEWRQQDLYTAHELCQMVPIAGAEVYERFRQANRWTDYFLPNASTAPPCPSVDRSIPSRWQFPLEFPLRGQIGDRLEAWEQGRKIARLSSQSGFGEETVFNADICQGHFSHHRSRTHQAFQTRLVELDLDRNEA